MPYLRTLSSFRDGVRKLAIAKGDNALKDILALSDKLRDVDLVPLGVALDDQEGMLARASTRLRGMSDNLLIAPPNPVLRHWLPFLSTPATSPSGLCAPIAFCRP